MRKDINFLRIVHASHYLPLQIFLLEILFSATILETRSLSEDNQLNLSIQSVSLGTSSAIVPFTALSLLCYQCKRPHRPQTVLSSTVIIHLGALCHFYFKALLDIGSFLLSMFLSMDRDIILFQFITNKNTLDGMRLWRVSKGSCIHSAWLTKASHGLTH